MSNVQAWERLAKAAGAERFSPSAPPAGFAFGVLSRAAAARREVESVDAARMVFRGAVAAAVVAAVMGAWNWGAVAGELGVSAVNGPEQVVEVSVEPEL